MDSTPKIRRISNPNISTGSADAFWTALDKGCATSSIVAADNYVAIVQLSGSGFLFKVDPPPYRFYIKEPGHA